MKGDEYFSERDNTRWRLGRRKTGSLYPSGNKEKVKDTTNDW